MLVFWIIAVIVVCIVAGGVVYRMQAGRFSSKKRMNGKTVVVTGATAGIGKYTALDLAKRGAKVILACRNLTKAKELAEWMKDESGNSSIFALHLDLSDLESVRRFSKEFLQRENKLSVLVNNAGCGMHDKCLSAQGFELTLATNHYGHFLLTHLLLPLLKKTPNSRIVVVSSLAHKFGNLDLDDMNFKKRKYSHTQAYSQSKLCNLLFSNELSDRVKRHGITVNALHPGTVATEIFNKEGTWLGYIIEKVAYLIGKTSESGAQTSIFLAVSDEVANISGEYFVDCKIAQKSKGGQDVGLARKLWDITEKVVELPKELTI